MSFDFNASEPSPSPTKPKIGPFSTVDPQEWFRTHTFHHREFPLEGLLHQKKEEGVKISLVIPTLNESATIGSQVEGLRVELMEENPLLDEILVIDSGSHDCTLEIAQSHGALVYEAQKILPDLGLHPGKGENLWKSLFVSSGDIIVWVDADIRNFSSRFVTGLLGPLLRNPALGLVKAFYDRPLQTDLGQVPRAGGRVTELLAKPLINLLFPELSYLFQPLAGEAAGRRCFLETIPYQSGYSLEIGMLADFIKKFGLASLAQTDMEERIHRNRDLRALTRMSQAILQTALKKSVEHGKLILTETLPQKLTQLSRIGEDYLAQDWIDNEVERPPWVEIAEYKQKFCRD